TPCGRTPSIVTRCHRAEMVRRGSTVRAPAAKPLSPQVTNARTDARTGLSPHATICCSTLQRQDVRFAGSFSSLQRVAVCVAGLLIPRSQVRSLPGPLDLQDFRYVTRHSAYVCAYVTPYAQGR